MGRRRRKKEIEKNQFIVFLSSCELSHANFSTRKRVQVWRARERRKICLLEKTFSFDVNGQEFLLLVGFSFLPLTVFFFSLIDREKRFSLPRLFDADPKKKLSDWEKWLSIYPNRFQVASFAFWAYLSVSDTLALFILHGELFFLFITRQFASGEIVFCQPRDPSAFFTFNEFWGSLKPS